MLAKVVLVLGRNLGLPKPTRESMRAAGMDHTWQLAVLYARVRSRGQSDRGLVKDGTELLRLGVAEASGFAVAVFPMFLLPAGHPSVELL